MHLAVESSLAGLVGFAVDAYVRPTPALKVVVAVAAVQRVVAVPASQMVIAASPIQLVVAAPSSNVIVAAETENDVRTPLKAYCLHQLWRLVPYLL